MSNHMGSLSSPSVFVTGTDTEVGKTVVAALLIARYRRRGLSVGFMKPVQSGAISVSGKLVSQDALFMARAAGSAVQEANSPYCFAEEASPYFAAKSSGSELSLEHILRYFAELSAENEVVVVEGAGGLLAPLTQRHSIADLASLLDLPVIIVCAPGLGTLNHTALTVEAARSRGLRLLGLAVNGCSAEPPAVERDNLAELERLTGLPVLLRVPRYDVKDEDELITALNAAAGAHDPDVFLREMTTPGRDKIGIDALAADDMRYIWHPFSQMKEYEAEEPPPPVIERGAGSYLFDTSGNSYLDGVSSLWVNVHGHRHARLDKALIDQAGKVAHSTMLGLSNVPAVELAKRLVEIAPTGLAKVFYSDSGSTAVEVALKIAFQYWRQKAYSGDTILNSRSEELSMVSPRTKFIGFTNAYHGDTLGSVSVGGMDLFHEKYRALLFDVFRVEAPCCYRCTRGLSYPECKIACLEALEATLEAHHREVAAVIIEPRVQGAAGMLLQPSGFLREVAALAKRYGVLLIADEVATGFGRTGTMFAVESEGVRPDIMCLAKGITGGYLPLAATLVTQEVFSAFYDDYPENKTFYHGHTYTGNPLACAVALANLRVFEDERVLARLQPKMAFMEEKLRDFSDLDHIGDIRQLGFMVGIELVADKKSKRRFAMEKRIGHQVTLEARRAGVIIRPLGDVIVLMPPLSMSTGEIDRLLKVTRSAIEKVTKENGAYQS